MYSIKIVFNVIQDKVLATEKTMLGLTNEFKTVGYNNKLNT